MTAPDARDELREAISRECASHAFRWVQQHPGWLARCSCRAWEEPIADEDEATAIHRRWRLHAADALLPAVTAYAERLTRIRVAEELRAIAVAHESRDLHAALFARADALAADDQPDGAR